MQAFKFDFQLSNCQLFNQWTFYGPFKVAYQKARKAIDNEEYKSRNRHNVE